MAEQLPVIPKNLSTENCEYASMNVVGKVDAEALSEETTLEAGNPFLAYCEHPITGDVSRLAAFAVRRAVHDVQPLQLALTNDKVLEAVLPADMDGAELHVVIATQDPFFAVASQMNQSPTTIEGDARGGFIELYSNPYDEFSEDEIVARAASPFGFIPSQSVDVHGWRFHLHGGEEMVTEAFIATAEHSADVLSLQIGRAALSEPYAMSGDPPILQGAFELRVVCR